MPSLFWRLVAEDGGQDLIEYALLAALVAIAGLTAINLLGAALGSSYSGWDAATENLWVMPEPGGGP